MFYKKLPLMKLIYTMFYKNLPVLNFIIAISAFTFQTTVLYPWHNDISRQINNLETKINKIEIK